MFYRHLRKLHISITIPRHLIVFLTNDKIRRSSIQYYTNTVCSLTGWTRYGGIQEASFSDPIEIQVTTNENGIVISGTGTNGKSIYVTGTLK